MIRRKRGRMSQRMGLGLAVFLLGSLTPGWAQQGTATPPTPLPKTSKQTSNPETPDQAPKTLPDDYTVSPEDQLDIQVMDVPELSRTYRVSANGFLTLPLLTEPIPAAGETLDQLSHSIATKFRDAGMLNNAQVTILLRETRLHAVLVTGEVKNPQSYPVYGPTRLLDLLMKAGGITPDASDNAIIVRGDVGARADLAESAKPGAANPSVREQTFTLNIRKLVETGDDKNNILLYPGDRVAVLRAELVYILGAVVHPGGYVLGENHQQMTLMKALAMAGDVTNVAKKSRITVLRRDLAAPPDALKREEIPVNYKAMVKGQIADMKLLPDDILYVPESSGLKAWRTSVNSVVQMATMGGAAMMIYR